MRKTMLDDCKGSKFEEVLAIFSTAVLKKVILEKNDLICHSVVLDSEGKNINGKFNLKNLDKEAKNPRFFLG